MSWVCGVSKGLEKELLGGGCALEVSPELKTVEPGRGAGCEHETGLENERGGG